MRLVVLAADPDGPVVRHRVRAALPALRAAGFDSLRVEAIPRRLHERFSLFRSLADADLVLLQRKLFTAAELRVLCACAPRLAYDLDDAVMFRDPARSRPISHVRRRRFRKTARSARLVTAGNAYLLGLVREDAPRTEVHLAPTPVDTRRYVPGTPGSGFRVGWIGSRATRSYLRAIVPALQALARERVDLTVAIMADRSPPELDGLPVEFTPWSEQAEVPFLQSLHVGVMPLTDDPFSRGKCGFKLLQYMACGAASIASPVGVNGEILADGEAGVLARGVEEWTTALVALAADADRRRDLGERARSLAQERWSIDELAPSFAGALARCARGGGET